MNALLHDIRFGFRMLRKNIGTTITIVLILGIGIGANTALFSLIYSVLLSPLPFAEPEQLMYVETHWKTSGGRGNCSGPDYLDWEKQNSTFESLSAMHVDCKFNLTGNGEPVALTGLQVTTNFWHTFETAPLLGRNFIPDDGEQGNERVIILSHQIWKDLFDADPNIIGKQLTLDESSWTVIGVAKPLMGFIEEMAQLYVPLTQQELKSRNRSSHYLAVMGRLKSNVTVQQANQDLNRIAGQLEELYIDSNRNKGVNVIGLKELLIEEVRTAFLVLYGAVGFLLLIACVNVANLLLAKAGGRSREISIRLAIGAGRFHIFRQIIIESMILGILGGLIGLWVAFTGLDLIQLISPKMSGTTGGSIPGFDEISINPAILLFTLLISILTSMVFGFVPACQISSTNMNNTLKDGGRGVSHGTIRHRLLSGLVVSEVALALILLIGSGLMIKSFYILQNTPAGFDSHRVLAIKLERPFTEFNSHSSNRSSFFKKVTEKIQELPAVEAASAINIHPMHSGNSNDGFHIEGRPLPPGEFLSAEYRIITQDYFKTMKIPLLKGRHFSSFDTESTKKVCIVNEEFVHRYFPNEEAIGKRIWHGGTLKEIVGIVGNVKLRTLTSENFSPFMYIPIDQNSRHMMTIVARTSGNPLALADMAQHAIWDIDPNQPVLWTSTMETIVGNSISVERFCTAPAP